MKERGAETRDRLVRATIRVIGSSGWKAATTRAVAQEAGVNSGVVHYHFGSVEELRRQALVQVMQDEAAGALQAISAAPNVRDGLVEAMRQLSSSPDQISDGDRVLVQAMGEAVRDDSVRPVMAEALAGIRVFMADVIAQAQRGGQLRDDVDAGQLAAALAALIDGLMLHMYIQPDLDIVGATAAISDSLAPVHDRSHDGHRRTAPRRST